MALLLVPEFLETLGELYFVIQVMVFAYMLFFLYMTFRDAQVLFGLSSLLAGYFIFVHGVSVTILVSIFVFVVIFGMSIQQAIQFGLLPLLGYAQHGDRFVKTNEMEQQGQEKQMQEVYKRAQVGQASEEELEWLQQQMSQQQMGQHFSSNQQRLMHG